MAKLYWYFAGMNVGKSTSLLSSAHTYKELGLKTALITAAVDDRYGVGKITSRLGLSSDAMVFAPNTNIEDMVLSRGHVDCVFVDEAQFLSREQVMQLSRIVDTHNIPVCCYGLKTDFKGELFDGSNALFCLADKFVEMKGICHCGRKATMVAKLDKDGIMVSFDSPQIEIGGNDRYVSMCRKHYFEEYDLMVATRNLK